LFCILSFFRPYTAASLTLTVFQVFLLELAAKVKYWLDGSQCEPNTIRPPVCKRFFTIIVLNGTIALNGAGANVLRGTGAALVLVLYGEAKNALYK